MPITSVFKPVRFGVGTCVIGRPQDLTLYNSGAQVSGASLYATFPNNSWNGSAWTAPTQEVINVGGTGTWECVSTANSNGTYGNCGLWLRVS